MFTPEWVVRKCFPYASELLYFPQQNGHLLGIVDFAQFILWARGRFNGRAMWSVDYNACGLHVGLYHDLVIDRFSVGIIYHQV